MQVFLDDTFARLSAAFAAHGRGAYTERQFGDDCRVLNRLNEAVAHGWLDVNAVGDPNADLLWRNASLQEFFAAYWATRWAQPDDLALLRDWLVDPLTDVNSAFYWFWRYASEMPDAVVAAERSPRATWVKAMAPLYDQTAVRSTEFIYRSWERMRGTGPQQVFLAEYPALLAGKWGTPEQQRTARELEAGFVPLGWGRLPGDTGTFWMGSADDDLVVYDDEKPRRKVTLPPYSIHKYCVQNSEFELFLPAHHANRWDGGSHPRAKARPGWDDRCPVVNVSWYDAFCFALWCGSRLPTEAEWEYACRAGTETPYAVGDGHILTADVCHFNQDRDTGYTIAVDGKPDNRWGLFQLHGNTREWCDSWYDSERASRVLRGGSWSDRAWHCRAALRFRYEPRLRNINSGFRLVRPGQVKLYVFTL
ncbi:MAG: formylglycine-generating enzyme family protein [Gemmataceae bacterium]|nr:formylglycine-generating enzyme family protein [Gemmataceae bacterium]